MEQNFFYSAEPFFNEKDRRGKQAKLLKNLSTGNGTSKVFKTLEVFD
jgi:hypothetical protein